MKKILQENPISITEDSIEDTRKKYNRDQQVECTCKNCSKTFYRSLRFISFPLYCRKCQIEQTAIKKYGSLENMQKMNLEHGKQTSMQKYGKDHFTNREKCKQTKEEKYGDAFYTNREKCKQTILERYGVKNPSQIKGISDKVKETKRIRYNNENYNNIGAAKETCLQRYGIENPGCIKATYKYNDIKFDSSWELYFWIYCIDHNINIKRAIETFDYYYDNKLHKYHPDFNIDGMLFEIKGDQFFKKDGTMQNPFDHTQDDLYEAKHQCGLKNNVIFLMKEDMLEIINYVNLNYPLNYIEDFKVRENV